MSTSMNFYLVTRNSLIDKFTLVTSKKNDSSFLFVSNSVFRDFLNNHLRYHTEFPRNYLNDEALENDSFINGYYESDYVSRRYINLSVLYELRDELFLKVAAEKLNSNIEQEDYTCNEEDYQMLNFLIESAEYVMQELNLMYTDEENTYILYTYD